MSFLDTPLTDNEANLINDIIDDNMEDFLYHLVTGKTNDSVFTDTKEESNVPEKPKKNKGREYIKLPDARIKKRKYKQRSSEDESNNTVKATKSTRKRGSRDKR